MLYLKRIAGLEELKKFYEADLESDFIHDNGVEYHICTKVPLVIVSDSGRFFSKEWIINFKNELIYDMENNKYSILDMYEKGKSRAKDIYVLLDSKNQTKQQVLVSAHIFEEKDVDDRVIKHIEFLSELSVEDTEDSVPNALTFEGMDSELLNVIDTLGSKDYYFMALVSAHWVYTQSYLEGTECEVEFDVTELKDLNELKGLI